MCDKTCVRFTARFISDTDRWGVARSQSHPTVISRYAVRPRSVRADTDQRKLVLRGYWVSPRRGGENIIVTWVLQARSGAMGEDHPRSSITNQTVARASVNRQHSMLGGTMVHQSNPIQSADTLLQCSSVFTSSRTTLKLLIPTQL